MPDWNKVKVVNAWGSSKDKENEKGIYYDYCVSNGIEYFDFRTARSKSPMNPFQFSCKYALEQVSNSVEKKTIKIYAGKRLLNYDSFLKKACKLEPNFLTKFIVFKDMRNRGYIVKTALKFGADFRVYDKGIKPGQDHAKWILYPVAEGSTLTWHEFAAKNRVAHSTRKRLLIAIVDDESDVTYYEISWKRP